MDQFFRQGDVHSVINIATPHFGSRLANILHTKLNRPRCVQRFRRSGAPIDEGAIEDLREHSGALTVLNESRSSLRLHNVVGRASEEDKEGNAGGIQLTLLQLLYCGRLVTGGFDGTLRDDNDLMVPVRSQLGGFSPSAQSVSSFPPFGSHVIHTRANGLFEGLAELESEEVSRRIIQLLDEPKEGASFTEFQGR